MRPVVDALPSGVLAEGMRDTLADRGVGAAHVAVLAVWGIVAAVLTSRTFRWE
jgi:ABC-2 type transport system permease protein